MTGARSWHVIATSDDHWPLTGQPCSFHVSNMLLMNKSCASWYGKYLMYIIWVPNSIARCYPPTNLWNMWFFAFLQCPSWTRLAKWPNADGAGPRSYPGPPKHHWLSSNLTQLLGTVCLMRSGKLLTRALLVVSNRYNYCLCTYTTQKNWTIHGVSTQVYSYDP